jgi:hypothetical protein
MKAKLEIKCDYSANNDLKVGIYKPSDVVSGLENSVVLKKIFGEKMLKEILESWIIEINNKSWEMWVDQERKLVNINKKYLRCSDCRVLYLDLVHELVHFKQMLDGKDLFDDNYKYVDRPTELEAYRLTVEEAGHIGMTREEIVEYLRVDWISDDDHKKLVECLLD